MIDFSSFWGVLGRFLDVFGGLGESFGRSWGGLGGSLAALEASWEALGGSGGHLGSILGGLESPWVVKSRFRASKPLCTTAFGGAKGGQDEAKMGPKTDKNRSQK